MVQVSCSGLNLSTVSSKPSPSCPPGSRTPPVTYMYILPLLTRASYIEHVTLTCNIHIAIQRCSGNSPSLDTHGLNKGPLVGSRAVSLHTVIVRTAIDASHCIYVAVEDCHSKASARAEHGGHEPPGVSHWVVAINNRQGLCVRSREASDGVEVPTQRGHPHA